MVNVTDLEAGEAQEQAGAHADLVHKVPVASFDALPDIAHDMHAQNLDSSSLDIAGQLCKLCQVLRPLHLRTALLFASLHRQSAPLGLHLSAFEHWSNTQ